ncbi:hypothetical protein BAUCODRAFT_314085 [Baudoinia panamericana UAMH 10762]|uniref:Uncharacterized protein n=1 Tax=Baudoinia panamericana (strain UAMH 10762) TaxID=717646 RepID=M2MWU0_BAUPA|nr:uncharacterized protein BAUCODRAFT_314085 [Baudoinia panamericana UAMH 10762]EMC91079.1 hypothetical protein BAUCODRAFT_314085 [Baudoinia panamericana UAMH 10762]
MLTGDDLDFDTSHHLSLSDVAHISGVIGRCSAIELLADAAILLKAMLVHWIASHKKAFSGTCALRSRLQVKMPNLRTGSGDGHAGFTACTSSHGQWSQRMWTALGPFKVSESLRQKP